MVSLATSPCSRQLGSKRSLGFWIQEFNQEGPVTVSESHLVKCRGYLCLRESTLLSRDRAW